MPSIGTGCASLRAPGRSMKYLSPEVLRRIRPFAGRVVDSGDRRCDPPAHREISDHRHPSWVAGRNEIVEDLIGRRFVKNPAVPVLDEIVFQRFEFNTQLVRHVGDPDFAKVW